MRLTEILDKDQDLNNFISKTKQVKKFTNHWRQCRCF